ncbi:MAG: adenosylcobinamide-phosphate synthase CbiB [Mariprofundaceae bacterium]|nr:adenosylcobinamide-phosphate synthase CbiB [Mariprofundaceae bacterium]
MLSFILALFLEFLIGDPMHRWHPVAVFGRWANVVERKCYHEYRISHGILAWLITVLFPLTLLYFIHQWVWATYEPLGIILNALLIWSCIGWKSLLEHVSEVFSSIDMHTARAKISRIVSRDTTHMDREDIHRAALESLSENASDSVVAPLFMLIVLGPIGIVFYRMSNTLDAMWGYKNMHYYYFGRCAARVDDVLNWVPARLTAVFYLILAHIKPKSCMVKQAREHVSINSGWPETALAYALDIRLGGPVKRHGRWHDRPWMGSQEPNAINLYAVKRAMLLTKGVFMMMVALTLCCEVF